MDDSIDGDFEKFQPCCYMKRDDPEFLRLKAEAESIPITNDPRKEIRRHWILNRFTDYQSPEWSVHNDIIPKLMEQIGWQQPPELRTILEYGDLYHQVKP